MTPAVTALLTPEDDVAGCNTPHSRADLDSQLCVKRVNLDSQLCSKPADIDSQLCVKRADIDSQLCSKPADIDSQLCVKRVNLDSQLCPKPADIDSQLCVQRADLDSQLRFKPVDLGAMARIWPLLAASQSRTCDFSYGGLLIWAPLFNYEYAILHDTLFIRGRLGGDFTKRTFSLPVGEMPLHESLRLLADQAGQQGERLRLSAVPEYALPEIMALKPANVAEQPDWADYLYDIAALATLSGKKMAKKRNHVNKFEALFPDAELHRMTAANIPDALLLLESINASAPDVADIARAERQLCADTLALMASHPTPMHGAILYAHGRPAAFTVGDIKADTLFIHIEKADRAIPGAYEAINKYFAARMLASCPGLRYVNREDDAGDPGLRHAKRSYHPLALLKKYDVTF